MSLNLRKHANLQPEKNAQKGQEQAMWKENFLPANCAVLRNLEQSAGLREKLYAFLEETKFILLIAAGTREIFMILQDKMIWNILIVLTVAGILVVIIGIMLIMFIT